MSQKHWRIALAAILFFCLVSGLCLSCGGLAVWLTRQGAGRITWPPISLPTSTRETLRLFGSMPATLDPALVQDAISASYVVEIFSGLVTLDQNLKVTPDIAERWEISEDGTTYTFYLREGVAFHDGKPVTAEDFKFSLERTCDPALGSPVAASYLGDILGAIDFIRGQAEEITGVQVIDEYVLQITIDSPKSYFLSKLTYPTAFVVDRENVERENWLRRPNGTGPFKLSRWDKDLIELVRNDAFYRGPAYFKRVRFMLSGGVPITLYENDELDIAQVGLYDIERVQDPTNPLHKELVIVPSLNVQYIGFNVDIPPFDDVKVRQAFNHATDKAKLSEVVLKGMASPAQGILPPGLPGYNEQLVGLDYNPDLARELIAQSKYGSVRNFPPIVLHISDESGTLPNSIEALLAMWEGNLGVEVTVEATDWPTFLQDINQRRYQMFSLGWIADYPDPQNFLDLLFYSDSDENHTNYANPKVDQLLLQARTEQDVTRRFELYQQAEEIIIRDAVWIPLWHDRDYYLVKPYIKGMSQASTIVPWLKDVYAVSPSQE